jgi:hypothetical protein
MRATSDEFEHEIRTNSAGFRDVEHAIPKPPGAFRILGLGDSFTLASVRPTRTRTSPSPK